MSGKSRKRGSDRRRAERMTLKAVVEVWLCDDPANPKPLAAVMIDFSPGGIGLVLHQELGLGCQFLIMLGSNAEKGVGLYTAMSCKRAGIDPTGNTIVRVGAQLVCVLRGDGLMRKAPQALVQRLQSAIPAQGQSKASSSEDPAVAVAPGDAVPVQLLQ